jgi:large subunit ribosomal protein L24
MDIRRDDTVEVITGADKGRRERVLRVFPREGRVVVEHVAYVTKHFRRGKRYPQGARVEKEAPIAISNVMLVCTECDKGVRIAHKTDSDGNRVRVCRRCGSEIETSKGRR